MSLFYTLAYRLGFRPWEHAATHPPAVRHIDALFTREEGGREPPHGRALDLGCGTAHWSLVLDRRGWEVTGIELDARAVQLARERVRAAGASVRIVNGDVTALQASGVGSGFRLVWDFGTVHGLNAQQRRDVAREISAVAADDATVLLLAWAPGRRGPLPRGMSRGDITEAFDGWRIDDEEPFDATGLPGPLRSVDPRVYRLVRV